MNIIETTIYNNIDKCIIRKISEIESIDKKLDIEIQEINKLIETRAND